MSITDELREITVKTECASGRCEKLYRGDLEHAADRIDEGIEREYVKLPVDADGVPIRVGDVLDPPADCDDYVPLQVVRLMYDGYEQEWFFDGEAGGFCGMVGEHMDVAGWTHHHEPTVEDVLREFFSRYVTTKPKDEDDAIIAEYAAKLRLAGEDE